MHSSFQAGLQNNVFEGEKIYSPQIHICRRTLFLHLGCRIAEVKCLSAQWACLRRLFKNSVLWHNSYGFTISEFLMVYIYFQIMSKQSESQHVTFILLDVSHYLCVVNSNPRIISSFTHCPTSNIKNVFLYLV